MQRRDGGGWDDYADQSGEVPVTLKFPSRRERRRLTLRAASSGSGRRTSRRSSSAFDTGDAAAPPRPAYRFVVDGKHRKGGAGRPATTLASRTFEVQPVERHHRRGPAVEPTGAVSASRSARAARSTASEIGPIDYPDTYDVPRRARFINGAADHDARPTPTRAALVLLHVQLPSVARPGDADRGEGHDRELGRRYQDGSGVPARRPLGHELQPRPQPGRVRRARGGRGRLGELQRRRLGACRRRAGHDGAAEAA